MNKLMSLPGNIILVFIAVLSTLCAVISAFHLPVSMSFAILMLLFVSAATACAVSYFKLKGLLVISAVSLLSFIWIFGEIIDGAKLTINIISGLFSNYMPIITLFPDINESVDDVSIFIIATGTVIALLLCYTICLRRSLIQTMLVTFPIIILTFMIARLQSDAIYLLGIISVYLTLLIAKALGPDSFSIREKRTLPALAAAVAIVLLAYMLAPQADYTRNEHIGLLGDRLKSVISGSESFGSMFRPAPDSEHYEHEWLQPNEYDTWQFNTTNVTIADAGRQTMSDRRLLEISVNIPGTFYLRGYSMIYFNGRSWWGNSDSPVFTDDVVARSMPAALAEISSIAFPESAPSIFEMTIRRTGDITHGVTYRPYFGSTPEVNTVSAFYYIHNGVHPLMRTLEEQWPASYIESLMPAINRSHIYNRYTDLDAQTAQELRQYALDVGINTTGTRAQIADSVARHVKSSATYTLTPSMSVPEGENFAIYFLENIKEGYCIHFTTAAVLMLRALDIPARFTSGYVVTVPYDNVDDTVIVTDRNAHAWVEIFYDDVGWLYLEATPSGNHSIIPAHIPHAPTEQNTPAPAPTQTPEPFPTPNPDEMDTPPPSTPDGESSGQTPGKDTPATQETFRLPPWAFNLMVTITCIAAFIMFVLLRRNFTLKRRFRLFRQKNTNTATLYVWRYIKRLGPPDNEEANDIEELALKARFSQHRLTIDERNLMITYANTLAAGVYREKSRFGKLWMKYVRVLV